MKKRTWVFAVLALTLAAVLTTSAATDGPLTKLYDAGESLLFDTDNVTVNGTVVFSLDGERFKTVNAAYMQDGTSSSWKYQLFTPQEDGEDRESGYTVIANGEDLYVLDKAYPGTYRMGFDEPQNTLVRHSALMDQVVTLARIAVRQSEPLLGDAVKVTAENHTGLSMTLDLQEENISELINNAFNLCVQMGIRRLISQEDFDTLPYPTIYASTIDRYHTTSAGIIACTRVYHLDSAQFSAVLDGNGNLRSISGSAAVRLETNIGDIHRLDITFDVSMSKYGTTRVSAFDPEQSGYELQGSR